MATAAIEEVWLNPAASMTRTIGECVQYGDVVFALADAASSDDIQTMLSAGIGAADALSESPEQTPKNGRYRFPVPQTFSSDVVFTCEEVLLRVLDRIDDDMPYVYSTLFEPSAGWASRQPLNAAGQQPVECPPTYLEETCPTLRELYMAGELEWSEGEPAINVYTPGGLFGCHKDHLALTVLIPLTAPDADFSGGGTGFWAGGRAVDEDPLAPPTKVLTPAPGTALVFGGDVTHAGMPVEAGLRSVFVASFSTRTDASNPARCHGLQEGAVQLSDAFADADPFADGLPSPDAFDPFANGLPPPS
jgi:hypothetical protein